KTVVLDSIMYHAGKKYELDACVVMENHVHLILTPLEKVENAYYGIPELLHSIKSYSANRIQRLSGQRGSVWLGENWDRIIRSDKDWYEKLDYIVNNPIKAGLVERAEDYRWLYFAGLK
ncbi:MAG: hypothetical protein Q8P44_00675, partial [Dehalococcoidia bacterium]|nr:hypothetical protein [Dehalococcoidia bacterium]